MKTFEERTRTFQEGLTKLMKECDIEPIPTIGIGTGAIIATITLIDLQNPDMLKKYGRTLIKNVDEEPQNPLAN
jgi:hypothetical protein